MPYKDPQQKQEWERRHRLQRLARRRQLRRVEAAQQLTQSAPLDSAGSPDFPWYLLAGGGLLALYNPAVALGAGTLILVIAGFQKRGWQWWALGSVILAIAIFFLPKIQRADATDTTSAKT